MHRIRREWHLDAVEDVELGFAPVGRPLLTVHFYRLDGWLIDTGQSNLRRTALTLMADGAVRGALLTHHHEDHSGNAAEVKRRFNVPVLGTAETKRIMRRRFPMLPYRHLCWGRAGCLEMDEVASELDTGRYRLTAMATPGHCADHCVYLERNRGWLFSGDMAIGDHLNFFREEERIVDHMASLKKLLKEPFDVIFCAHRPLVSGGKSLLRRKLQFFEDLFGRAWQLADQGLSIPEIIREMDPKKDRFIRWFTFGDASYAHMIRSCFRPGAESYWKRGGA